MADADAHAPLEVCVFNIGANVNFPILETTERVFRKVWEMACYAGFLAGREAARLMLPRGKDNIFFRRRACAAEVDTRHLPAPSSAYGRSHRQPHASSVRRTSMSPISSSIPTRHRMGAPAADRGAGTECPRRSRSADAAIVRRWLLYQQPKNAWTFELEIRPFGEKW